MWWSLAAPRYRLYYSLRSSASLRAKLAVRLLGLDPTVELVEVVRPPPPPLPQGNRSTTNASGASGNAVFALPADDPEVARLGSTDFLKFNPEGRVPVLVVLAGNGGEEGGGRRKQLTQSSAIIEFLDTIAQGNAAFRPSQDEVDSSGGAKDADTRRPVRRRVVRSLIPADPWQRARVTQIASIVACDIHPLQNRPLVETAIFDFDLLRAPVETHPFRQRFIRRGFAAIERLLAEEASVAGGGGGRYAVGDEITKADVFLLPQVRNAFGAGIDVAKEFPRIFGVFKKALKVPAIRAVFDESGGAMPNNAPAAPKSRDSPRGMRSRGRNMSMSRSRNRKQQPHNRSRL